MAVADRVLLAVERAHGRAGAAVALGVVQPAVTRASEGLREHGPELDALDLLRRLFVDRPVRLHGTAEMDAAAVEDREARLHATLVRRVLDEAVVADERRAPAHLSLVGLREIRGDHERPLREVLDRPQVGVGLAEVGERRQDREAEHRQRDHGADRRAEAERRGLEESRARIGGERRRGCGGCDGGLVGDGPCLGLDGRHLVAHVARDLARPEDPEHDRDDDADRGDDPADDQPDEEARDPDREGDRPQARARCVRGVVVPGSLNSRPALDSISRRPVCQRRAVCRDARILHVAKDGRQEPPYSAQRRVTRSRDLVAHDDLLGPRAARPPRGACGSRRCRACRRRTAVPVRGRGGRAGLR